MSINLSDVQSHLDWLKQKLYYNWKSVNTNACQRKVKRGQVYYCDLGVGVGSEEKKNRPCLILQNDVGNINSPNTIIAPITSEPGEPKVTVPIIENYTYVDQSDGLIKKLEGNILLGNIVTVSKARLGQHVNKLRSEMKEVDEKLLVSLGVYDEYLKLKNAKQKDRVLIKKLVVENQSMKTVLDNIIVLTGANSYQDILQKIACTLEED